MKFSTRSAGLQTLAIGCWIAAGFFILLIPIAFFHGFPFLQGTPLRMKSLRKPFEILLILFLAGLVLHPRRGEIWKTLIGKLKDFAARPASPWLVCGIYFLLFLWEQISRYLALEINFIPFLFYDYMMWYFDHGKMCFTGFLHGFYHTNLILLGLYPVWKIFQSGWVLHITQPLMAVAAGVPFYFWSKDQLKSPGWALGVLFLYLNFRYLVNILSVNFAVEIFYPLFIFSAVYFASKRKQFLYYLFLAAGLLIKEDAPVYFGALGLFFLFKKEERLRGTATIALSAFALFFMLKIFMPWTGNNLLPEDMNNFRSAHTDEGVLARLFQNMDEKIKTLYKLTSRLLFFPWLSPWMFLVAAALAPLFLQGGDYFVQLMFHYAAAVLPFLFLAFVDGLRRILKIDWIRQRQIIGGGIALALLFANGLNLRPFHFTLDDIRTIKLAKSIPQESIVLAQGHLLPYLGYRKFNFYISPHFEKQADTREAYTRPDYFLFDFDANAYPLTPQDLRDKGEAARRDPGYELVFQDHRRLLLKRRGMT